jgi:hypothetical protein
MIDGVTDVQQYAYSGAKSSGVSCGGHDSTFAFLMTA